MTTEEMRGLLRKSGQKATLSRVTVLKALQARKHPTSAQDLIEALRGEMDQATIYRILKIFKDKGLIRQIDLRHNHAHYEIVRNDEHHHLICNQCGRIEDVHHCGIENTYAAILKGSKYFSEIDQHALEFYGVCKKCQNKSS